MTRGGKLRLIVRKILFDIGQRAMTLSTACDRAVPHVRRHALTAALAVSILASSPALALTLALTLGRAQVHSAQGSALNVTLPINDLSPEDQRSLSIRLAPEPAWSPLGLTPPAPLSDLRVQVDGTGARRVVRITSSSASTASTIDLLFIIGTASGERQVQFSVLAPAPGLSRPASPTSASVSANAGSTPATRNAATDVSPLNTRARGNVTVRRNDTLSEISEKYPVAGATYYQILVAMWQANPTAFFENNMNLMHEGVRLSIPSAAAARAVDPALAQRLYTEQLDAHARYRARLGAVAGRSGAVAGGPADQGRVQTDAGTAMPAATPQQDRLRLSSADGDAGQGTTAGGAWAAGAGGAAAGAFGLAGADGAGAADGADQRRANELALKDVTGRINQLQRNVDNLRAAGGSAASTGQTGDASRAGQTGAAQSGVAGSGAAASGTRAAAGEAGVTSSDIGPLGGALPPGSAGAQGAADAGADDSTTPKSSSPAGANGAGDNNGSLMSASGLPAWLTDNLLIVLTAVLALIAFIIAWVARRAAARREDQSDSDLADDEPSDRSIDPALIDKRLNGIDLDLNNSPTNDAGAARPPRADDARAEPSVGVDQPPASSRS